MGESREKGPGQALVGSGETPGQQRVPGGLLCMGYVANKKCQGNPQKHSLPSFLAGTVLGTKAAKGKEGLGSCLYGHVDPVLLHMCHRATSWSRGALVRDGVAPG